MTVSEDLPSEEVLERVARVVAVEDGVAWLESEVTPSCSGCLSLAACGSKGGSGARAAARRFPLSGALGLLVGDMVVVGTPEAAVVRAAVTAYGVPLATMIGAAIVAQELGCGDGTGALAILGGLGFGLVIARGLAARLSRRGDLSPRFLRRVKTSDGCARG